MDTQSVVPAAQPVAPAATPRAAPAKTSRGIVKKKGWSLARVVYSKNCLLLCRNGLIVRMEEPGLGRNMVMVRGPPPAVHLPLPPSPILDSRWISCPRPRPRRGHQVRPFDDLVTKFMKRDGLVSLDLSMLYKEGGGTLDAALLVPKSELPPKMRAALTYSEGAYLDAAREPDSWA